MKLFTVLLMVGLAGCAWGQQSPTGGGGSKIVAIGNLKCADNQHIEGDGRSEAGNHCMDDAPKPLKCGQHQHVEGDYSGNGSIHGRCADDLKCGKYEYVYHWPGNCGPSSCDEHGACLAICSPLPPDHCAPIMHEVTEKDWQELLARLKALENKR